MQRQELHNIGQCLEHTLQQENVQIKYSFNCTRLFSKCIASPNNRI